MIFPAIDHMAKRNDVLITMAIAVIIIVVIFVVFFWSGLIKQPPVSTKDPTAYVLDGVKYQFTGNMTEAWKFGPVIDENNITNKIRSSRDVVIVFNGSSQEDNGYFAMLSFNLVAKLQSFYTYTAGRVVRFGNIDFNNASSDTVLSDDWTYIYLVGPKTGANKNVMTLGPSLMINNQTTNSSWVYIEAADYSNLTKGVDKLALMTIGYKE